MGTGPEYRLYLGELPDTLPEIGVLLEQERRGKHQRVPPSLAGSLSLRHSGRCQAAQLVLCSVYDSQPPVSDNPAPLCPHTNSLPKNSVCSLASSYVPGYPVGKHCSACEGLRLGMMQMEGLEAVGLGWKEAAKLDPLGFCYSTNNVQEE